MADAPTTCTIANKTKAILVLNLPHSQVPEHAVMGITATLAHTAAGPEAGSRQVHVIRRPISGSVTLLAKGHDGDRAQVARTALACADVRKAIAAGQLEVLSEKAAEKHRAALEERAQKIAVATAEAFAKAEKDAAAADDPPPAVKADDPPPPAVKADETPDPAVPADAPVKSARKKE